MGQLWIEQYGNVEVINHRWKNERTQQNLLGGPTENTDTEAHAVPADILLMSSVDKTLLNDVDVWFAP